ncbi:co-chaperone GrpE [Prevotella sp. DNF00663]|uniref:nucleotide exchange factor GrpE n=1 Tax=Prevotella sp. DNF00663 TaxID=1384078 RepID=UPI00079220EC|nr:nucleotide exchange factor GrpE [Prevotella sp. DNF00663]KXB83434.1 co-chaperone GrpE [Prevotella sp. DNF00663]
MMSEENIKETELNEDKNQQSAESTENQQEDVETQEAETKTEEPKEVDPLTEVQQKLDSLTDQYLRTVAEFENYKKRTRKEKAELIENGGERSISAILPIIDDFERALDDKTEDPKAIKEGMELIFKKFMKSLEGLGVKKIDTEDAEFNTDFHEAIAMVPGMGDDKKGKIIDCVLTGYTLNNKVIRHAKVAVGQ